jgi:predicted kinase
VIFVGLPASGKTTFFRERFAATHEHVSKDNWPNAVNKNARQARAIAAALAGGRSVVVDNTNPTPEDRRAVIEQVRALGARVIGYFFDASTREVVGRNRGRTGRQRVPDAGIFAIAKRMVEPRLGEGFDELYRVSIAEGGRFDVRPDPQSPFAPPPGPAADG